MHQTAGMSTPGGDGAFSSSSRLTTELLPKSEQQESITEQNSSIDNSSSCHITVGTQSSIKIDKPHRPRKRSERSPVVAYSSLPTQAMLQKTNMLYA